MELVCRTEEQMLDSVFSKLSIQVTYWTCPILYTMSMYQILNPGKYLIVDLMPVLEMPAV